MEAAGMGKFQIQAKKCINHFKNSQCNKCSDLCPQQAISNGVIDMNQCNACGLCLSVCPSRAVTSSIAYQKNIESLTGQKEISLYCQKKHENSLFPCLAFLDARLLFTMAQDHAVDVELSNCVYCNPKILNILKTRLNECNAVLMMQGKAPVNVIERAEESHVQNEEMNRRLFLKQMLGATVSFIELLKVDQSEEVCIPCHFEDYIRAETNQKTLEKNPLFFSCVINEGCNACGLCRMICPQKALQGFLTKNDFLLKFDKTLCYQCHVCENNCAKNAILITEELMKPNEFSISLPLCKNCGQPFFPIENSEICIKCYQRSKVFK